jgi:HlyD family secretion protein
MLRCKQALVATRFDLHREAESNAALSADHGTRALRRTVLLGAGFVLLLGVGAVLWRLQSGAGAGSGLLEVNGRIEGDLIAVGPKTAGRVAELLAREGDEVKQGQLLARLDDMATDARFAQASSTVAALDAQAAAQQSALELLRAETGVQLAAARAGVESAQAEARRAQAAAAQEARDLDRVRRLAAQGFVGPQAAEKSELMLRTAREQEAAARAALKRAQQALRDAELAPQRIRSREAEVQAIRAQAQAAAARAEEAASQVADLKVSAPVAGRISNRYANLGEVVAAGTPLFGLTDLPRVYLKAYLPEPMIGRIRLGQAAQIWTDAFPDTPIEARAGYIASRAEFTPKEVQTRDERTKLVYEVRLYPTSDPRGKLLPGQPADGMIRLEDNAPWQRPQR